MPTRSAAGWRKEERYDVGPGGRCPVAMRCQQKMSLGQTKGGVDQRRADVGGGRN
jgi:hypothetical protein